MSDPWWPPQNRDPAFQTRREEYGAVEGGDYVRGSDATLPRAALRYPKELGGTSKALGQSGLTARPYDYETVELHWHLPNDLRATWQEMAIVRSVYGAPSTVRDGVTVDRGGVTKFFPRGYYNDPDTGTLYTAPIYDRNDPARVGDKKGLIGGRWYYYSLFFRVNPVEWKRAMTAATILPNNWHHSEYLWEMLPPYYRTADDNLEPDNGPLRNFFKIFGFEMDTTREFVESWQKVYSADYSPMRLLRRVGENFGMAYEQALGDVRYRSLISRLGELYDVRGTPVCLEQLCEAATKYQCSISQSPNLLLLPDDSDFYGTGINFYDGTGSWAGLHPEFDATEITTDTLAPSDKVQLLVNLSGTIALPEENSGRGSMKMTTPSDEETMPVVITCGCGITAQDRELVPLLTGIPVLPGHNYGFTIQIQAEIPKLTKVLLLWFSSQGQPTDYVGKVESVQDMPIVGRWHEFTVQGMAPEGAYYLVPAVYFMERDPGGTGTTSPAIHLAGAMVYDLGEADLPITTTPPDRYLTLGDPAELIGAPKQDFDGYLMGEP